LLGQFGGLDLFDGKLSGDSVGRPLLDVGVYERVLHLELLLGQLEDTVLIDSITDLAKKVGDVGGSR
jgi:hypothetical protein